MILVHVVGEKSRGVKNSRETRSIELLAFDEKHVCTKVCKALWSNSTRFDGDKTEWNSIRPADSGCEKKLNVLIDHRVGGELIYYSVGHGLQ